MGKQTKGRVKSQQAPLLFGCAFASGKDRQINGDKEQGREGKEDFLGIAKSKKCKDGSLIQLMKNENKERARCRNQDSERQAMKSSVSHLVNI